MIGATPLRQRELDGADRRARCLLVPQLIAGVVASRERLVLARAMTGWPGGKSGREAMMAYEGPT